MTIDREVNGEVVSFFTNEEARVSLYSSTEKPTIPSSVTPDTPLDALNLNWREKDLPEKERTKHVHRLHPYLGKFIPCVLKFLFGNFTMIFTR